MYNFSIYKKKQKTVNSVPNQLNIRLTNKKKIQANIFFLKLKFELCIFQVFSVESK